MEHRKSHARPDEFSEQFTSLLHAHWSDILQIINRQSPRVASLLRVATPTSLKRMNGIWRIQIMTRRLAQHEKLRQPHDNQIVAQSVRLWAHSAAQLKLPRVTVDFEL